jgi:UrcA family protein
LLAALLLAAGNAGAADRTATSADIAVKFSDVQLNSEADAETLYKKLRPRRAPCATTTPVVIARSRCARAPRSA